MEVPLVDLVGICKEFDGNTILNDYNLSIKQNEFVTLLGPSGCGKTTLLRCIAGFEQPDAGKILFEGKDITSLPAHKRPLNTVFQKYSLFSHMTVAENIAFGLKISKKSKKYIADKVDYALKLVDLDGFGSRMPNSLSGGQQQRVAIARAIVNEPRALLLDEPLSALDLKLRQDMQYELIRLKNELGISFIFVTHDQEEALTMSDTVVVMNQGRIQQMGTPQDIYNEPTNAFVAGFVGDSNIIDVVIRPEDVEYVEPERGIIKGVVSHIIFKGVHWEMEVEAGGFTWLVQSTNMTPVGTEVGIYVRPENIQVMHKPQTEDEEALINE